MASWFYLFFFSAKRLFNKEREVNEREKKNG